MGSIDTAKIVNHEKKYEAEVEQLVKDIDELKKNYNEHQLEKKAEEKEA